MKHPAHPAQISAEQASAATSAKQPVRRAIDTDPDCADAPCWVAYEAETCAIVVYEDEPDCTVSTGNFLGRFQ